MRRMTLAIVGGALGLAALAGYLFLNERPLVVPIVSIERDVPVTVYGLGTVEARILSRIGFEVGAALTELSADSGDRVSAGQVLARLHPSEQEARIARAEAAVEAAAAGQTKAEAAVARARADLAQYELTNARQQALARRNTISDQTAEEAERDVAVAAADLAVAESEIAVAAAQHADATAALRYERVLLDHHELHAPFDAVVVARHVEAGTVVRAGEPVFTLIDPASVWTLAYIDEARAGAIALGQPAEIRLRSLPHSVFTGHVSRIGIESDRVNEERRVWITCDTCPAQVYLGEQAEIRITVATLPEALLVPEIAIRGFDGHTGRVWTVMDGAATEATVTFGHRTEDSRAQIVDGLPVGADVVAVPVAGLTEGRRLRTGRKDAP
ncbi:efflux RND transporter periplasmic adaptor subunit [Defluviimonas sp. SAOS-178_SWC]|uniref:efflux RND transporter periplasmic adaptor subunit n=1 Tax=Defluviimonas sp. SAOS-178_SWC TaxID=3121287 RepID=UPI003221F8C5